MTTPADGGSATTPERRAVASDRIQIELPLTHRHGSTVRAVAASGGAELGFSVDEIDDLRLGVNEAVSVLADVGAEAGDAARLHIVFTWRAHERVEDGIALTVRAWRDTTIAQPTAADLDPLASRILAAVMDSYEIGVDGVFTAVKSGSVTLDRGAR
jgi:hypothetical protein